MCGLRYSEVTCASSLLNVRVDSKLVRLGARNFQGHFRSGVYNMVESEPKDEVVTFEREFKLKKFNNCTVALNVSSK